jgi:hypothetical protein
VTGADARASFVSMSDPINDAATAGREGLRAQLGELEAFVARTEAEGEELPPEAVEMIARLREIVRALDGLTSSLGGE